MSPLSSIIRLAHDLESGPAFGAAAVIALPKKNEEISKTVLRTGRKMRFAREQRIRRSPAARGDSGAGLRALALTLPLILGACSLTPDWADPTEWFDDDRPAPSAQVDEDAQLPNLATVPDEPRAASPDDLRAQTADGLAADHANAQYSGETLTAGTGLPQVPAAPAAGASDQEAAQQIAAVPQVPQAPTVPVAQPAAPAATTQLAVVPAPTYSPQPVLRQSVRAAVIYFPYGSAKIDAQDRQVLRDIAILQRQRNALVRVVGHASARTGNKAPQQHQVANFNISLKRANAVAAALVSLGVERGRVTSEARADSQPVFHEFMPNGEAGNRRAEIFLEY